MDCVSEKLEVLWRELLLSRDCLYDSVKQGRLGFLYVFT